MRGTFAEPGPATAWIRLRVPLVAGETTSGLVRVAAAADFGNGISWVLSRRDGYRFINPDLTIYLHRHPVGDWIALEATASPDPAARGMALRTLAHVASGRSVDRYRACWWNATADDTEGTNARSRGVGCCLRAEASAADRRSSAPILGSSITDGGTVSFSNEMSSSPSTNFTMRSRSCLRRESKEHAMA